MSVTHGGRARQFEWSCDVGDLVIENENGLTHIFPIEEIADILLAIKSEFAKEWFPLANNVEKMYRGTEKSGLGSIIYSTCEDTFHAQGASYLGVVLDEVGILEWNGESWGIEWRVIDAPRNVESVRKLLSTRVQ